MNFSEQELLRWVLGFGLLAALFSLTVRSLGEPIGCFAQLDTVGELVLG